MSKLKKEKNALIVELKSFYKDWLKIFFLFELALIEGANYVLFSCDKEQPCRKQSSINAH